MANKLAILLFLGSAMLSESIASKTRKQEGLPHAGAMQQVVLNELNKDLEYDDGAKQLFALGDETVPTLIKYLSDIDKEKRASAAKALAYIGNRQGMQALRNAVKSERDKAAQSMMSFFLAGGLVGTTSESDLNFLRNSVSTNDESGAPALSAALTLGMMERSDSLGLLRKVENDDAIGVEEIGKAIRWIEKKSIPQTQVQTSLSEDELIKTIVLDRTFFAEEERDKTSVTELTFNSKRNKVLVSLEIYNGPKSARGYDLVLSKTNREWKVEGIWFAWVA